MGENVSRPLQEEFKSGTYSNRLPFKRALESTKARFESIVQRLEAIFVRHGIPEIVFTDNGIQLIRREMLDFAEFKVIVQSPAYPQGNELAEAAVKISKKIFDADFPSSALMLYRATPTSSSYGPVKLLMNQPLRTTIPAMA